MGDVFCEVRCVPISGPRCGDKDSMAERCLALQSSSAAECCTPAPTLIWEATYADMFGLNDSTGASPHRRAVVLPGAWAMGEGVLLELDEASGQPSPTYGSGSPDSLHGSFSRMAGSLTATMGSYLSNLASAIAGCTRSANTNDVGGRSPSPSRPEGIRCSSAAVRSGVRAAETALSNKKTN